jgi:hypothetical protein
MSYLFYLHEVREEDVVSLGGAATAALADLFYGLRDV